MTKKIAMPAIVLTVSMGLISIVCILFSVKDDMSLSGRDSAVKESDMGNGLKPSRNPGTIQFDSDCQRKKYQEDILIDAFRRVANLRIQVEDFGVEQQFISTERTIKEAEKYLKDEIMFSGLKYPDEVTIKCYTSHCKISYQDLSVEEMDTFLQVAQLLYPYRNGAGVSINPDTDNSVVTVYYPKEGHYIDDSIDYDKEDNIFTH